MQASFALFNLEMDKHEHTVAAFFLLHAASDR
jgi:hypothetical protein